MSCPQMGPQKLTTVWFASYCIEARVLPYSHLKSSRCRFLLYQKKNWSSMDAKLSLLLLVLSTLSNTLHAEYRLVRLKRHSESLPLLLLTSFDRVNVMLLAGWNSSSNSRINDKPIGQSWGLPISKLGVGASNGEVESFAIASNIGNFGGCIDSNDRVKWKPNSKGAFLVKSVYWQLNQRGPVKENCPRKQV